MQKKIMFPKYLKKPILIKNLSLKFKEQLLSVIHTSYYNESKEFLFYSSVIK